MKRESAGRILKPSLRLHKNSYEDRKGNPRDRESNNKFEKKKGYWIFFLCFIVIGFLFIIIASFYSVSFSSGHSSVIWLYDGAALPSHTN